MSLILRVVSVRGWTPQVIEFRNLRAGSMGDRKIAGR